MIDLNDNTFTEVGSRSMAAVLPSLEKLRVINFGDCLVRPEGAQAIADAIRDGHQRLEVSRPSTSKVVHAHLVEEHIYFLFVHPQEVNLSYGELDQDAGLAIAGALTNKKALKTIELNGKYCTVSYSVLLMCSILIGRFI